MVDQVRRTVAEIPAEEFVEMLAKAVEREIRAALSEVKPVTYHAVYEPPAGSFDEHHRIIDTIRVLVADLAGAQASRQAPAVSQ